MDEIQLKEQDRYKEAFEPVPQIIAAAKRFFVWEVYELPQIDRWYRGKVVLIGDAAHAMPPSAGQGLSQAIEDCSILAKVLSKGADLSRYEELRKARIQKMKGEFKWRNNVENRGPLGQWFIIWVFWAVFNIASWVSRIIKYDPFRYDADTVDI